MKWSISDILGNGLCLLLDNNLNFFYLEGWNQFLKCNFCHPASQYSGQMHRFQGTYKCFKLPKKLEFLFLKKNKAPSRPNCSGFFLFCLDSAVLKAIKTMSIDSTTNMLVVDIKLTSDGQHCTVTTYVTYIKFWVKVRTSSNDFFMLLSSWISTSNC